MQMMYYLIKCALICIHSHWIKADSKFLFDFVVIFWISFYHSINNKKNTVNSQKKTFTMLLGVKCCIYEQCWGKLLLKVMHYNIALLPKKVTNYVT